MNKFISPVIIIALLACALLFTACPVSSKFPLGNTKEYKIDKGLLGTWQNDSSDAEAKKVTVKRRDEYTYHITVDIKGSMFMAEDTVFTGWLTEIKGTKFLCLQLVKKGVAVDEYYVYAISSTGDKIQTNDIGLLAGGTDAITSIETYRKEVTASMEKEGFLSSAIVWEKE